MKKTIGILGGMGPLATADLFQKIIANTNASCDQEHIPIRIDSNTAIPDRTAAILHSGVNPVPEMVKSAVRLEKMGAEVLMMPCNTAHYFLPEIKRQVSVPFLNMLQETAGEAKRRGIRHIGLLATDGTISSGVYEKAFSKEGIELSVPDADGQKSVMDVIYKGIKAGDPTIDLTGFYKGMDQLFQQGAQTLVLGCTELPLAFARFQIDRPFLDPTMCLALAAVRFAGGEVREESTTSHC